MEQRPSGWFSFEKLFPVARDSARVKQLPRRRPGLLSSQQHVDSPGLIAWNPRLLAGILGLIGSDPKTHGRCFLEEGNGCREFSWFRAQVSRAVRCSVSRRKGREVSRVRGRGRSRPAWRLCKEGTALLPAGLASVQLSGFCRLSAGGSGQSALLACVQLPTLPGLSTSRLIPGAPCGG